MNTPWILDEVESELVAECMLEMMMVAHKNGATDLVSKIEALLAQYCGPRKLSIDYKEWKFVRFI